MIVVLWWPYLIKSSILLILSIFVLNTCFIKFYTLTFIFLCVVTHSSLLDSFLYINATLQI